MADEHRYTYMAAEPEDGVPAVVVCNDCGAFAPGADAAAVVHCASCTPGESAYWEDFYADPENSV
jgi:hypothetical protein